MSDDAIHIVIQQGPRAALVRLVHDRSKARRIAAIDARLATETDPDIIAQLEQRKQAIENETVNRFILGHFKVVALAEERELQRRISEAAARQRIKDEIREHLDKFNNL